MSVSDPAKRPSRHAPIALTMGEPAGIGGEITLKAWCRRHQENLPSFFILDDPSRLAALARAIGLDIAVAAIEQPEEALALFPKALPVLGVPVPRPPVPGRPDPANGRAVMEAIDKAVALTRAGRAAAIVTNPIHKKTLYDAGFHHPGHTEYLGALAGGDAEPVMMLVGGGLRVVPVTIHLPLKEAIGSLSRQAIVTQAKIVARSLQMDFGIARPRLGIAGLNPHAGEDGALGREEIEIIAPAVSDLRNAGIDAIGPLSPDTMFHDAARTRYDAAICMYHDQALIPLKTLAFDTGVNVTLGLPFVRTSPDHGTAFNIAGTGTANPNSLIAALALADAMANQRARHLEQDVA
ncbi:MAG TPA: 4-hydroxythreonine-4-phosphate dehydrogenase PdxA [Alphaproteobacteria bacterium]